MWVEILRFGIVGVTSNVVLFLLYLFVTNAGVDPKLVVTALYLLGLVWTFCINKRWSFSHRSEWGRSGLRYFSLYGGLYFANVLTLLVLVDFFQIPHAMVQIGVFIASIPIVFLMQRYWVFA